MIEDIRRLLDEYIKWVKDKTILRQVNEKWVEITTPHLDRHNDNLQIYAKKSNGAYLLTDDGYTVKDLEQSGCRITSVKRKAMLDMTLNGFGVQINDGSLEVIATDNNFALQKHNLLQAILAVNDLFYLAKPMVENLFYEDVLTWLNKCEIRFVHDVKFTGKSGFDHRYNFAIPKSKTQPERIIQTINKPDRESALRMAFSWLDTKDARIVQSPDSRAYAFLNDIEKKALPDVEEALRSYAVVPVPWSKRDKIRDELAA